MQDIPLVYEQYKEKMLQKETGFFAFIKQWNKKRQFDKFRKNKHDSLHAGSRGENKVIEKLSKLDDRYHVFCGLHIWLSHPIRYNGLSRIRSAQMDFVIASKKGVFVIEVKNWSNDYVKNYDGLQPHEQVDRAGRVLWITLQNHSIDARITNVLLSIQGNMQHDQNCRMVFVSSLERINGFLENRQNILSEIEVVRIVDNLKRFVTRQ